MFKEGDVIIYKCPLIEESSIGIVRNYSTEDKRTLSILPLRQQLPNSHGEWVVDQSQGDITINKARVFYIVLTRQVLGFGTKKVLVSMDPVLALDLLSGKIEKAKSKLNQLSTNRRNVNPRRKKANYVEFIDREKYITKQKKVETNKAIPAPRFESTNSTNMRYQLRSNSKFLKKRKPQKQQFSKISETASISKVTLGANPAKAEGLDRFSRRIFIKKYFVELNTHCQKLLEICKAQGSSSSCRRVEIVSNGSAFKLNQFFKPLKKFLLEFKPYTLDEMLFVAEAYLARGCLQLLLTLPFGDIRLAKGVAYIPELPQLSTDMKPEQIVKRIRIMKEYLCNLRPFVPLQYQCYYNEAFSDFCCYIVKESKTKIEENSIERSVQFTLQVFFGGLLIEILEELFELGSTETYISEIMMEVIKQLNLDDNLLVTPKQTYMAKKLNYFLNKKFNQTHKKWSLFVDCCTRMLLIHKSEVIEQILDDSTRLKDFCDILANIQTSVAKGIYMGFMRAVIGENVVRNNKLEELPADMSSFMNSLIESNAQLPIFVHYARAMQHKYGDLHKIARSNRISPLESFAQKYMGSDDNMTLEDLKYAPAQFSYYMQIFKKVVYLISTEKEDDLLNFSIKCLSQIEETDDNDKDASHERNEQYLFMLVILNEFYLQHIAENCQQERSKALLRVLDRIDVSKVNSSRLELIRCLLLNFPSTPLAITGKETKDELRNNYSILHSLIVLSLTDCKLLSKRESEQTYYQRGQLAAYPGKEEQRLLLIANTFRSIDDQWRAGQAFTKLYKCSCGYLYWIGDCGRAWVISHCPQCKQQIGGEKHQLINSETGGKEIDKEYFFAEMYNPFESRNEKIYQFRDRIAEDVSHMRIEPEMMENEIEAPDIEPAKVKITIVNEDEIQEDLMEQEVPTDQLAVNLEESYHVSNEHSFTPLRNIDSVYSFSLIEFIGHSRYLLDAVVGPKQDYEGTRNFLQVKSDYFIPYLLAVLNNNISTARKSLSDLFTSEEQFFRAFNLYLDTYLTVLLKRHQKSTRNELEGLICEDFDHRKSSLGQEVVERVQLKNNLNRILSTEKKLIQNWMNNLVSLDDFKEKGTDIKLVSGMRIVPDNCMVKFRNYIKLELQKESKSQDYDEIKINRLEFVCKIIGIEKVLLKFRKIITAHFSLLHYIYLKYRHRISYSEACSMTIAELIEKDRDGELKERFEHLIEAWHLIDQLKEDYSDIFDFRFLCHEDLVNNLEIDLILDPSRSRLIYFIPHSKKTESMFVNSAIHTLSKFQNKLLDDHQKQYFLSHLDEAEQVGIFKIKQNKRSFVGLECELEHYVNQCCYPDLRFNKDQHLLYDLARLERLLSEDIFAGSKKIAYDDEDTFNFPFKDDFRWVFTKLMKIIEKSDEEVDIQGTYNGSDEISRFEAAPIVFSLIEELASSSNTIREVLLDLKSQINTPDEKIFVESLISKDLTITNLAELYYSIEYAKYLSFREKPILRRVVDIKLLKDPENKDKLKRAAIHLFMTQLLGQDIEKLTNFNIADCFAWTDEAEDLDLTELKDLDIKMGELQEFINSCLIK